jgi:hypothetical protein
MQEYCDIFTQNKKSAVTRAGHYWAVASKQQQMNCVPVHWVTMAEHEQRKKIMPSLSNK